MPTLRSKISVPFSGSTSVSAAPLTPAALKRAQALVSASVEPCLDPVTPEGERECSRRPSARESLTPILPSVAGVVSRRRKMVEKKLHFDEGGGEGPKRRTKRLRVSKEHSITTVEEVVNVADLNGVVERGKEKVTESVSGVEDVAQKGKGKRLRGRNEASSVILAAVDNSVLESRTVTRGKGKVMENGSHFGKVVESPSVAGNGDPKGKGKVMVTGSDSEEDSDYVDMSGDEEREEILARRTTNSPDVAKEQAGRNGESSGRGLGRGRVSSRTARNSGVEIAAMDTRLMDEIGDRLHAGTGTGGPSRKMTTKRHNAEAAKARFRDIARRRAAHFAHFAGDADSNTAVGVHAGSEGSLEQKKRADELLAQVSAAANRPANGGKEDWPGPWSTARRIVEDRDAAVAARQDAFKACGAKAVSFVEWLPTRTSEFRKDRVVPSLHDMCVDVLCSNVEHVESLFGLPDSTKKRISAGLCARRKLSPTAGRLFFEGAPGEICIPDCTQFSEEILSEAMGRCSAERLEVLELGMCGRCVTDQCLSTTFARAANSMPLLNTLSLRGAYRLMDKGISSILCAAPAIRSLDFTQCSLITEKAIEAIAASLGPTLETLLLESCKQFDAFKLLPFLLKMSNLQKLSLAGVPGVSDGIVSELSVVLGKNLQELSLAECPALTDAAVGAVSLCCAGLRLLDLSHVPLLTDMGIGQLADGCRSLAVLRLNRGKFSDTGLAGFVGASGSCLRVLSLNSVRQVGDHTLSALAQYSNQSLELLDVSWCRTISEQALGVLADSCLKLHTLQIFGCTQISKLFLEGHSNPKVAVVGISHLKCLGA